MQTKKARELKEMWGDKPCSHPSLDKEYELGSATGDYVCTTCGKSGWGNNWNSKSAENTKSE